MGVRLNLASHLPHHATTSPYYCEEEEEEKGQQAHSKSKKSARGREGGRRERGGKGSDGGNLGMVNCHFLSNPLYNGVALSELAAAIAMRRPTTESKAEVGGRKNKNSDASGGGRGRGRCCRHYDIVRPTD